jgi:hypothetical protein
MEQDLKLVLEAWRKLVVENYGLRRQIQATELRLQLAHARLAEQRRKSKGDQCED